jgi:hypothetical protein
MAPNSQTLSVYIESHPDKVNEFVSTPENLPRWATTFVKSLKKVNGEWIAETSMGAMRFRFTEMNRFGVSDQYIRPASGPEIYVPIRVLPNNSGSEVIFTLLRLPEMSNERLAEDARMVESDLKTLKKVLEGERIQALACDIPSDL